MTLTFLVAVLIPSAIDALIVLACVWMAARQQFVPSERRPKVSFSFLHQTVSESRSDKPAIGEETKLAKSRMEALGSRGIAGTSGKLSVSARPLSPDGTINHHQIRRKILEKLVRRMKGGRL